MRIESKITGKEEPENILRKKKLNKENEGWYKQFIYWLSFRTVAWFIVLFFIFLLLGVDFGIVKSWSWVKIMVLRSWSLTIEFCRSLPTEILKTTRCAEHLSFVSIEW